MQPDTQKRTVIVAEDDPATLRLLARHLERAGYEVIPCEDGRQAFTAICDRGSGLVVTDLIMPHMDGIELCSSIRAMVAENVLQTAYCLLVTAQSDKEQLIRGLEAGADDYLTKPYHPRELLARIGVGERICNLQQELVEQRIQADRIGAQLVVANQKLEALANTDVLTGLLNRRRLLERGAELWSQSGRSGAPLSCMIFDVDHFKKVNDSFGHAAGDQVLRAIGKLCKQVLRPYDVCGRFGGEEFAVFCPDTACDGAAAAAERLRQAVREQVFEAEGREFSVTISIGIAQRCELQREIAELITAADTPLYDAKRGGRDRICFAHATPPAPIPHAAPTP